MSSHWYSALHTISEYCTDLVPDRAALALETLIVFINYFPAGFQLPFFCSIPYKLGLYVRSPTIEPIKPIHLFFLEKVQ